MPTLSLKHRAMMEYVFEMRDGYVLGYSFTNKTFKDFILMSVGIDVYDTLGYKEESSKARKLRHLVKTESDTIVGKVILDLLKQRDLKISRQKARYGTFKLLYNTKCKG